MPNPNNRTKMTGDTHLPEDETEVDSESEFATREAQESTVNKGKASDTAKAEAGTDGGRDRDDVPGLKDREAKTSNSYGNTRKG